MGLLQYKAMVLLQHVRELRDREEGQALVGWA